MRKAYKKPGIVILLCCCCCWVNGQQLNFDLYSRGNGLINNEVHSIMQASNGFMYFGTPSGLSIFDGASFASFDRSKGFGDNMISAIRQLPDGEVVLFTNNNEFYRLGQQRLSIDSSARQISIKTLYQADPGSWYASTFSGLYRFTGDNFTGDKLERIPISQGSSYPGINCVIRWQDSLLIVGRSYEPVQIYNVHNWKLVASSVEKIFVRDLCRDKDRNIWISSIGAGVLLMKPTSVDQGTIHFEKLPAAFDPFLKAEFRSVVTDKENNQWMGTINQGLVKYNTSTGEFMHIGMEQGLVSNTIFSLYCDREDNVWIGTNRGVQKLVHKNVFSYASKQGLPADLVLDVMSLPGDRIVTSGYSGVGFIREAAGRVTKWKPPLKDEYISQFISLGNTYFGLSRKKLVALRVSPDNISVKAIYSLPQHFSGMTDLDQDKLLLGGDSSILLLNRGKIVQVTKDSVRHVSCMHMDASGVLWTGSFHNAINGYTLSHSKDSLYAKPAFYFSNNRSSAGEYIQCISTDIRGRILCGTSQSGIVVLSRENGHLVRKAVIDITSGLSTNAVQSFLWYNDSTLLVGTGYGLDKVIFPKSKDSFYVHNINDYYNFYGSVYCIKKGKAGKILLGTESGLFIIPSADIEKDAGKDLPVAISAVHILSDPDSLPDLHKAIELPFNKSGIEIFYSSPSFINEKNNRYVYLLTGGNQNNWSQPSTSNNVALLNLFPGQYRFVVKTVNILGGVSKSEASVDIIVRSAFWQRWWFRFATGLAVVATLYLMVRRRIRGIRRESNLKAKITEAEMTALRAQMNPHFIFNCMNSIDGLIADNRKEEAQDFLQKFSKLIRLVLENSQYQQVPLRQDLEALELYIELEVIRSNHIFTYRIDVDDQLEGDDYKIPPLLLQPYVENAILHGLRNKERDEGKLSVRVIKDRERIKIVIEDNGIGREKARILNEENKRTHRQFGMKVTGKRITQLQTMNQNTVEFRIDNICEDDETGTRVTIMLPYLLKLE